MGPTSMFGAFGSGYGRWWRGCQRGKGWRGQAADARNSPVGVGGGVLGKLVFSPIGGGMGRWRASLCSLAMV